MDERRLFPNAPTVGARVRLTANVDRYPHFIAEEGSRGTVACDDNDMYSVRMDLTIEGCEEWHNEVCWYQHDTEWDLEVEAI